MIHEDAFPFLILAALCFFAGVFGKEKENRVAVILFIFSGVFPVLAYISNAERIPVRDWIELFGFFAPPFLLFTASIFEWKKNREWNKRRVLFWVSAALAMVTSVLLSLKIIGIGRISV